MQIIAKKAMDTILRKARISIMVKPVKKDEELYTEGYLWKEFNRNHFRNWNRGYTKDRIDEARQEWFLKVTSKRSIRIATHHISHLVPGAVEPKQIHELRDQGQRSSNGSRGY
jgi:hypothetical protein